MIERSKTKSRKTNSPDELKPQTLPFSTMARKSPLFKKAVIAVVSIAGIFAVFHTFLSPFLPSYASDSDLNPIYSYGRHLFREHTLPADSGFSGKSQKVRVYMYDLPRKFTYGIIEQHAIARGGLKEPVDDVSLLKYPGHQHMHEWHIFADLNRAEEDRLGSPVVRVTDPAEADLFYVPVFSSLSLIANPNRATGVGSGYSDEEMQESLVEWLEGQVWWRRNNGRDHVICAGDPNALYRVVDRVKNAVLLVSDFGRLRADQGSLVKDVVIPYAHRVNPYAGDAGVENRSTLLFFMGNRYRKDGGKVRDLLFQVLENEEDVIIKHGTQSRESRRAATKGMHTSKFCLNPAGDTPSACRLFDSIVSLCVPVMVSDAIELPFEDVIDYRKFAIFVESNAALKPGSLVRMLRKVKTEAIVQYQKEMKEVRRYFEYTDPNGTVNEIWREISQKLPLIKLMINREKRLIRQGPSEPNCSCLCLNQTEGIITSL